MSYQGTALQRRGPDRDHHAQPARADECADPGLLKDLHSAFDEADADRKVKVIILTGAGAAFCAGFDQGQPVDGGTRSTDPRGKIDR